MEEKKVVSELSLRTTGDLIDPSRLGHLLTLDERRDRIQKETVHMSHDFLRRALLANIGIKRRKPTSENVIWLGCLAVFGMAMQLRSCLWLLDCLGVDYTYLPEREYCCGWSLREAFKGEERRRGIEASKYFIGLNIEQARKLGAKRMYHFCAWCRAAAGSAFPDVTTDIPQRFYLDLVVESLKEKPVPLVLQQPTRIAYYEGCHNRNDRLAPEVKFDWPAYRKLLDQVEGLEVVDLPSNSCCVVPAVSERLVDQAIRAGTSQLITPCPACWTWLEKVGRREKFPVKLEPELLLEAVGFKDEVTNNWRYGADRR